MTYGEIIIIIIFFFDTKKCVVTDIRSYSEWNNVARTWPMNIESLGIIWASPHTLKKKYMEVFGLLQSNLTNTVYRVPSPTLIGY